MGKIATAELTVGTKVQFSQLLPAWLESGLTFTQKAPPFFREVYKPNTERGFDRVPSDAETISDFVRELDSLHRSGENIVVNLEKGEVFAFVTWKQGGMCEFSLVGSTIRLPNEQGKQAGWIDWNYVVSLIATPLNNCGIFIESIELYEDF